MFGFNIFPKWPNVLIKDLCRHHKMGTNTQNTFKKTLEIHTKLNDKHFFWGLCTFCSHFSTTFFFVFYFSILSLNLFAFVMNIEMEIKSLNAQKCSLSALAAQANASNCAECSNFIEFRKEFAVRNHFTHHNSCVTLSIWLKHLQCADTQHSLPQTCVKPKNAKNIIHELRSMGNFSKMFALSMFDLIFNWLRVLCNFWMFNWYDGRDFKDDFLLYSPSVSLPLTLTYAFALSLFFPTSSYWERRSKSKVQRSF